MTKPTAELIAWLNEHKLMYADLAKCENTAEQREKYVSLRVWTEATADRLAALEAEIVRLRNLLEEIVDTEPEDNQGHCIFCGGFDGRTNSIIHKDTCILTQARKALQPTTEAKK
jgi:hypothetical protein